MHILLLGALRIGRDGIELDRMRAPAFAGRLGPRPEGSNQAEEPP
jgi:hypothetical protein